VVQGEQAITYRYSCFVRNAFQSPHGTPGVVATPPDQHDAIWAVQKALDFPRHVFGVERPPACCMDLNYRRTRPNPVRGQAMRMEIGRPSSSIRLSA
jgi:hypothetical protein